MKAPLNAALNRLETLTGRERAMMLVMVPVVLGLLAELLVFDASRKQAGTANRSAVQQDADVKALTATLATMPATAQSQATDQLERQRDELLQKIQAARQIKTVSEQGIDWGTVVRAGVSGNAGLRLTQFKTLPAEVVFSLPAPDGAIYRHRMELTVKGDFSALLAYLQSLQGMPGGLRWDRLTLGMDAYPQASARLVLYTLSPRPDTPFN